jgi:hypothetical protein
MNSDEVNWLLQTIEDPENAKRFVQAQYQRGRIPYHVMARLARDRNWTDWPAIEKPAVEEVALVILGGGAGSTIGA